MLRHFCCRVKFPFLQENINLQRNTQKKTIIYRRPFYPVDKKRRALLADMRMQNASLGKKKKWTKMGKNRCMRTGVAPRTPHRETFSPCSRMHPKSCPEPLVINPGKCEQIRSGSRDQKNSSSPSGQRLTLRASTAAIHPAGKCLPARLIRAQRRATKMLVEIKQHLQSVA